MLRAAYLYLVTLGRQQATPRFLAMMARLQGPAFNLTVSHFWLQSMHACIARLQVRTLSQTLNPMGPPPGPHPLTNPKSYANPKP